MGRSLAALATQQSQGNPAKVPAMRPLRDLQVAINQRAVEHLGLRLPSQDKKKFEIIFPAP
jgi:putative ABC transport system substrate-binding protein